MKFYFLKRDIIINCDRSELPGVTSKLFEKMKTTGNNDGSKKKDNTNDDDDGSINDKKQL